MTRDTKTRIYLAETSLDPETHTATRANERDPVERLAAAASRPANEQLATDTVAPALAELVERREALRAELADAQRAASAARRALGGLGPIRRRRRGPGLVEQIEQAQTRIRALRLETTALEKTVRIQQREQQPPSRPALHRSSAPRSRPTGIGLER